MQGIMMNQLLGNRALFDRRGDKKWEILDEFYREMHPKFLIGKQVAAKQNPRFSNPKYAFRAIARTTDSRTIIGSPFSSLPAGNSLGVLIREVEDDFSVLSLGLLLSSFVFDWQMRRRIAGTNINWFFMQEAALPLSNTITDLGATALGLTFPSYNFAGLYLGLATSSPQLMNVPVQSLWGLTKLRRMEMLTAANAIAAYQFGLTTEHLRHVLLDCSHEPEWIVQHSDEFDSVGFWRVEKDQAPEHRQSVLSIIAFESLLQTITEGGNQSEVIAKFASAEGWQLPETLRLADYGLGHDARALEHQPVRSHFGPRFYDWQLEQTPEDSWQECHLHARNLLGPTAYQTLLDELNGNLGAEKISIPKPLQAPEGEQRHLF
jgi:hypothetical protein